MASLGVNKKGPGRELSSEGNSELAVLFPRVLGGDLEAQIAFSQLLQRGIRVLLSRKLGSAAVDGPADAIIQSPIDAIADRRIERAELVLPYVRVQIQQAVASSAGNARAMPDINAIDEKNARRILAACPAEQREVLNRYFLQGQDHVQVCQEMGLTAERFHYLKTAAKLKFGGTGAKVPVSGRRAV